MRKVELSLKENQKYQVIKKLVETNGAHFNGRRPGTARMAKKQPATIFYLLPRRRLFQYSTPSRAAVRAPSAKGCLRASMTLT